MRARSRPASRHVVGLLAAGGLAVGGCGTAAPSEPVRFAFPGRFVLASVPVDSYRGAYGYDEITADTLWLADGGAIRELRVIHTVGYADTGGGTRNIPPGESIHAETYTGTWQATGTAAQVTYPGDFGRTFLLVPQGDSSLVFADDPQRVYARR